MDRHIRIRGCGKVWENLDENSPKYKFSKIVSTVSTQFKLYKLPAMLEAICLGSVQAISSKLQAGMIIIFKVFYGMGESILIDKFV